MPNTSVFSRETRNLEWPSSLSILLKTDKGTHSYEKKYTYSVCGTPFSSSWPFNELKCFIFNPNIVSHMFQDSVELFYLFHLVSVEPDYKPHEYNIFINWSLLKTYMPYATYIFHSDVPQICLIMTIHLCCLLKIFIQRAHGLIQLVKNRVGKL